MDIRGLDWNLGPPDRIHKLFARRKQRQRVDTSEHKSVGADIEEERGGGGGGEMDDIIIEKEHYLKKQNSSLEGAGRVKHEA